MLEAELGGARARPQHLEPQREEHHPPLTSVGDFVQEVGNARIYEGIHFRSAVDAGTAMGVQIGLLAAEVHFAP